MSIIVRAVCRQNKGNVGRREIGSFSFLTGKYVY